DGDALDVPLVVGVAVRPHEVDGDAGGAGQVLLGGGEGEVGVDAALPVVLVDQAGGAGRGEDRGRIGGRGRLGAVGAAIGVVVTAVVRRAGRRHGEEAGGAGGTDQELTTVERRHVDPPGSQSTGARTASACSGTVPGVA